LVQGFGQEVKEGGDVGIAPIHLIPQAIDLLARRVVRDQGRFARTGRAGQPNYAGAGDTLL